MDASWIKNLAKKSNSQFTNRENDLIIRERIQRSFDFIMGELYEEFSLVVNMFNEHSNERIKILSINPQQRPYPDAIILLKSGTQIKVMKTQNSLEVIASMVQDFRQINHKIHSFVPRADTYGSVNWLMDNQVLMNTDLMVKQLFQDLCFISSKRNQRR